MTQAGDTRGPQDERLLVMTIDQAFNDTVACFAERETLVLRRQNLRYSWAELAEQDAS